MAKGLSFLAFFLLINVNKAKVNPAAIPMHPPLVILFEKSREGIIIIGTSVLAGIKKENLNTQEKTDK